MTKIPVVFAFDDNYALPASIALKTLMDSKKSDTEYEVIIFHAGLKTETMKKIESICSVRWMKIDASVLKGAPTGYSALATYYRLFMADLLPEYDKIIWSDVDVFFKGDLSDIYNQDMQGADWGGIRAEVRGETLGVHTHFPENKKPYVYMPGFMLVNAKQWREKKMLDRFLNIINKYGPKLRMFDLDVLNLAANKIMEIPFNYCVLDNVYHFDDIEKIPEYPWLSNAWKKEDLLQAKENPIIIHYAGGVNGKIWRCGKSTIPAYYWDEIVRSPFYRPEDYECSPRELILYYFLKAIRHWIFVTSWRKKVKAKIKILKEKRG